MHFAVFTQRMSQTLAAADAIHHQCNVGFEAGEITIHLHETIFEAGVTHLQRINHLAHGRTRHAHRSQTTRERTQEGGNPNGSQRKK